MVNRKGQQVLALVHSCVHVSAVQTEAVAVQHTGGYQVLPKDGSGRRKYAASLPAGLVPDSVSPLHKSCTQYCLCIPASGWCSCSCRTLTVVSCVVNELRYVMRDQGLHGLRPEHSRRCYTIAEGDRMISLCSDQVRRACALRALG